MYIGVFKDPIHAESQVFLFMCNRVNCLFACKVNKMATCCSPHRHKSGNEGLHLSCTPFYLHTLLHKGMQISVKQYGCNSYA